MSESDRSNRRDFLISSSVVALAGAGLPITLSPKAQQESSNDLLAVDETPISGYDRFTDRARNVMKLAEEESRRLNHQYIGTEHLLLGLVREGQGVGINVLINLQIEPAAILREVEKIVAVVPGITSNAELPWTPRARKVIEQALHEARQLNHNYVGTEHILLGLVRDDCSVSSVLLSNLGLTFEEARNEVQKLLGNSPWA